MQRTRGPLRSLSLSLTYHHPFTYSLPRQNTNIHITRPFSTTLTRPKMALSSDTKEPIFRMPARSPQPPSSRVRVCVLGAGNFGSCLADHLGDSEHDVLLWSRDPQQVTYFNAHHRNVEYFTDHVFPDTITAIGPDLPSAEVIEGLDVLLFAIPTEGLRSIDKLLARAP